MFSHAINILGLPVLVLIVFVTLLEWRLRVADVKRRVKQQMERERAMSMHPAFRNRGLAR